MKKGYIGLCIHRLTHMWAADRDFPDEKESRLFITAIELEDIKDDASA